jgi:hypothetical protein
MNEVIMRRVILLALIVAITPSANGKAIVAYEKNGCDFWYAKVIPAVRVKQKTFKVKDMTPAQHEAFQKEIREALAEWDSLEPSDPDNVTALSDEQEVAAIGCLLNLETDTRPSKLDNPVWLGVSELFVDAPVNLAALYYISYLYTGNMKHSYAVALTGPDAMDKTVHWKYATTQRAIHIAYKAYRLWYAKVKEVGLVQARASKLSPLAGTGLAWYGQRAE